MRVLLTKDHYIVLNIAEHMCKSDRTQSRSRLPFSRHCYRRGKYLLVFEGWVNSSPSIKLGWKLGSCYRKPGSFCQPALTCVLSFNSDSLSVVVRCPALPALLGFWVRSKEMLWHTSHAGNAVQRWTSSLTMSGFINTYLTQPMCQELRCWGHQEWKLWLSH